MPSITSRLSEAPDWFRRLSKQKGIEELQNRLMDSVPIELQLFYRFPAFACSLHSGDTDMFLNEYSDGVRPPVVKWRGINHLVIASFPYASCIQAVALGSDNPRVAWGYDGAVQSDVKLGPLYFADWITKLAQIKLDEMSGISRNAESTLSKPPSYWRSFFFPDADDPG